MRRVRKGAVHRLNNPTVPELRQEQAVSKLSFGGRAQYREQEGAPWWWRKAEGCCRHRQCRVRDADPCLCSGSTSPTRSGSHRRLHRGAERRGDLRGKARGRQAPAQRPADDAYISNNVNVSATAALFNGDENQIPAPSPFRTASC